MIKSSTKSAFESDAKMVLKQLEFEKLNNDDFDITTVNEETITNYNLSNIYYENLSVSLVDNKPYINIVGKGKWDGLKVCGTIRNITVSNESDAETCKNITDPTLYTYYNKPKGVNAPQLATGMTPIKWNGNTWMDTTESDVDWYNYTTTDKKWANARTADGSMWVWIPRYIYKVSSGWHTATTGTIEVQFSIDTDDTRGGTIVIDAKMTANASNNKWTNHPAFTFGDTEVAGIWVAKFEASNDGSDNVKVAPNVSSWRNIIVNNIFNKARSMETNVIYGWGITGNNIDTHMMENTEWGAVAYLSKATYGKNAEIWINNSNTYTTGCAGSYAAAKTYSGCQNTYDTSNGQQASTTGNIYGIYDMSGGAWEYVSAYVDNGHINLTTYGNSAYTSNNKYKNKYDTSSTNSELDNYLLTISSKGDAIYETSNESGNSASWFTDYSYMSSTDYQWLLRGGMYSNEYYAGVFAFSRNTGDVNNGFSFRPVLLVGAGL
jgi:hypothetical protein